MFDFPSSPALNATYTSGGKTYVWDGQKWKQRPNAEGYTARTANAQNLLTNGGMTWSQQWTAGATYTTNGTYVADQWLVQFTTTGTPAFALIADSHNDGEVVNWIRLNATVADTSIAATEFYTLRQPVEGWSLVDLRWGTPQAKPAVLCFKAHSNVAGKFCVAVRDSSAGVGFHKLLDIAANTTTLYVIPIPSCTMGTWNIDSSLCMHLQFTIMAGSNYTTGIDNGQWNTNPGGGSIGVAVPGISNWMSAINQWIDIGNVALYFDPDGTGLAPPWQQPDFAAELLKCKRYYQRVFDFFSANVTSGGLYYAWISAPINPRTTPTLSGVTSGQALFPATVGTLSYMYNTVYESRTSNGSGNGVFDTVLTVDARMA